jgi:dolichol-phosphate mannosyltransferase
MAEAAEKAGSEAPELSVVVPCFNEEQVLPAFHKATAAVLEALDTTWEMILVDDGSQDQTAELLRGLSRADTRIRYLILARNHGHQLALRAGMSKARGRAVLTLDSDLQHPPEMIPSMLKAWRTGEVDSVLMVRSRTEKQGFLKRLTAKGFYALFNYVSDFPVIPGCADFRLLDRRQVQELLACGDQRPFYRGLVHWAGGRVETLEYQAPPRAAGETKYSLLRMLHFAMDGIFSFSLFPLRVMFLVSGGLLALVFLYGVYVLLMVFVFHRTIQGWASLMGLILILFSYVSVFLGILGEYIGRIYLQTLARPPFLIQETEETRLASVGEGVQAMKEEVR